MSSKIESLMRLAAKFEHSANRAPYSEAKRSASKADIDAALGGELSDLAKAFQKEFPSSKDDVAMLIPKKIKKLINKLKSIEKSRKSSSAEIKEAKRKLHFLIYRHAIDAK